MIYSFIRLPLVGAFAALSLSIGCAGGRPPVDAAGQPMERLSVVTASGEHDFWVEIADDPEERGQGLMYREPLADDRGMLFEWPGEPPAERGFYMRNTPSSLDIIYVAADGRIVSIAAHTTPYSDVNLPSNGPSAGVLELNAGRAAEIGARPGDRIRHPYFQ